MVDDRSGLRRRARLRLRGGRRPLAGAGPSVEVPAVRSARGLAHDRRDRLRLDGSALDGSAAAGQCAVRAAHRDVHTGGHPPLGDRQARPPGRSGGRRCRADAGELVQRFAHGWGYDGVLWFAVDESYGGPRAYQAFVDACHQRGLAVVQDVVYNHLGPSGNHLPRYRAVPARCQHEHLGRIDQPRRARGASLHHRQRGHVAARLPRRWVAARRGARARRRLADAHPARAGRRSRGGRSIRAATALPDR